MRYGIIFRHVSPPLAAFFALGSALLAAGVIHAQSGNAPFATGYESTTSTSLRAASRILNQTSFGPTVSTITAVEKSGIQGYVDSQLAQPAYLMPLTIPAADYSNGDCAGWDCDVEAWWWQDALYGQDQLRQRVAYALSKLFVVSYIQVDARYYPYYLNSLSQDAFGNWFNLMHDVALSGAMGTYLNAANSQAPASGGHADENFARELMQLFSIGTNALNQDGSLKHDSSGNPVPNYTAAEIQALARAFTGYTFANADCSQPTIPNYYWWPQPPGATCAMLPLEEYHDHTLKTLLRGQVLPSGQAASVDFNAALQNIFQDPSLPPFVSRRLIQALVRSNPSPAYISRIAGVFIDNGSGVRGDMKAVVRAILLDQEARAADAVSGVDANAGLLRDPTMWLISVIRSLGGVETKSIPWDGIYAKQFDIWLQDLGEAPHAASSVFSFYSPDNKLATGALYGPEFQLENTESLSWMILHTQDLVDDNFHGSYPYFNMDLTATGMLGKIASQQGAAALVDALSALLLNGSMTVDMRASILTAITGWDPTTMVQNAVHLVVTSPQYRVMI